MPTIAETPQTKRLLSDLLLRSGDENLKNSPKRQRVCFDGDVELPHSKSNEERTVTSATNEELAEDEEELEFILSIGEDGDWDYTISTATVGAAEDSKSKSEDEPSRKHQTPRPASPFGDDHWLCEELYMNRPTSSSSRDEDDGDEGPMLRVDSTNSLGNNLNISLKALDYSSASDEAAMPMPLITPPSSPRTVRTVSGDGVTTEEATICEWPFNLTVDNAITSALESTPHTPLVNGCAEK
mmetsp:Transcript_12294/g.21308  ORF Transcript_12294/g.21308 Transcript_12294/m.21308 type:complete len:241 (-) Transcript_12294:231-953(-)